MSLLLAETTGGQEILIGPFIECPSNLSPFCRSKDKRKDKEMLAEILQVLSPETLVFVVIIFVVTINFHLKFDRTIAQKAPAFLTTLGILGTFIGIALGLLQFDPSAVQKSVPALINGIKTAFWAS